MKSVTNDRGVAVSVTMRVAGFICAQGSGDAILLSGTIPIFATVALAPSNAARYAAREAIAIEGRGRPMPSPKTEPEPQLPHTRDEIRAYLAEVFPQIALGRSFEIEAVGPLGVSVRMIHAPSQLRPGGTISGPSMFALADFALYVAILARIGPVGLAVTTNMNINFLRRPGPRDLIGEARLIKLGKRLAVGEVLISSVGEPELVAHAVGTYSIPPRGEATERDDRPEQ
jgi:uncharacterized protein (TIGR00369 family)